MDSNLKSTQLHSCDYTEAQAPREIIPTGVHEAKQQFREVVFPNQWDCFESFAAIPNTKQAAWEFIVSQCSKNFGYPNIDPYDHLLKTLYDSLPEVRQLCMVKERTELKREFHFTCKHFPNDKFPRKHFRQLFRESRTNLSELFDFWLALHEIETRQEMLKEYDKGNIIALLLFLYLQHTIQHLLSYNHRRNVN